MKSLRYLNKYFWKYKLLLFLGILFVVISNFFQFFTAPVVRESIDYIENQLHHLSGTEASSTEDIFNHILIFVGILFGVTLLRGVFLFLTRQTIIIMSRNIEYDLKNEVYQHYQSLPLAFYKKSNTGDLITRISEDVSKVRMYVGPAIMYGLTLVTLFALVIPYMFAINSTLAIYVLIPLPILSITIYFISNRMNKQSEAIQRSLSGMSTFVQEAFSGIRVLKSFAREEHSSTDFKGATEDYKEKSLKLAVTNALFFPLIMTLIGLSTIFVVYIGGNQVMDGDTGFTVGNMAEFILYVNMLTWPVTSLGWITSIIQRAAASQERINQFLREENTITSEKELTAPIDGSITFNNVSFSYVDTGVKALDNLSFSLKAGESLAILGTTGSGKSTIAQLIIRMYNIEEGEILIDGKPIHHFNVEHLRSNIGYVPQDVFLFSDSIKNNIAFGSVKVDPELVIEAAKNADVYKNIQAFNKGFDTLIGERGVTLSGGQKQRVSIARALIRNPKILILDDCLSAVDSKTENTILENLQRVMVDKTTIIISHRVSSAKLADKIIIMDDGKVKEAGSYSELLEKGGLFKEMLEKQKEDAIDPQL